VDCLATRVKGGILRRPIVLEELADPVKFGFPIPCLHDVCDLVLWRRIPVSDPTDTRVDESQPYLAPSP